MERRRTWATGMRPLGGQSPRSRQHPATPSSQSKPFKVFAGVEVVRGKVERDGQVACRYDTYLGHGKIAMAGMGEILLLRIVRFETHLMPQSLA